MRAIAVRAAWAFVRGKFREGVTVVHSDGVIRQVTTRRVSGATDLGNVCLLPGLVNAHTHLELTALRGKVPPAPFPEWARRLMALRSAWTEEDANQSAAEGVRLSLEAGVTAVGDFAFLSGVDALRQSALRGVSFRETLGIAPERAGEAVRRARKFLPRATKSWRPGLAPHAPYSSSAELYRALYLLAKKRRLPFSTHLSELEEEIEFLKTGTGPFRDMLDKIGRSPGSWKPPGTRPVAYLASIGCLDGALVAHANYLSSDDIHLLRRHRATVAWCPRTHAFFGHPPHPVKRLLAAGVPVALGTDSLASAPSLSVLDEILHARGTTGLPFETLLTLATENGARALRLPGTGRLAPGWAAVFSSARADLFDLP